MFNFSWGRGRVFGVDVFGDHYEKWWWNIFIWPVYSFGRKIRSGIMWIRYRIDPKHRYHMIDTRLKPNYYDIDHLMLHGMFSLLRRYVEEENEGVDELEKWGNDLLSRKRDPHTGDVDERQGRREIEAAALYRWWMEERPRMIERSDELLHELYGDNGIMFHEVDNADGTIEYRRRELSKEEQAAHDELKEVDTRLADEEQEMLHRLVDIRGHLWT